MHDLTQLRHQPGSLEAVADAAIATWVPSEQTTQKNLLHILYI